MKKLVITLLLIVAAFLGFSQGDTKDTYTARKYVRFIPNATFTGTPTKGCVYMDTDNYLYLYNGSTWDTLNATGGGGTGTNYWTQTGNDIINNNTGKVTITGDSLYLYPLPDEATKVGRIPTLLTNGEVQWISIINLYNDTQDSIRDAEIAIADNFIRVYSKDTVRAYSDFSTAVAAALPTNYIEVYPATYTESGTITLPANSTLRFIEGGQLSGTVTLVGNNTRLDAGLYRCFGDNVTITGTWIVDKTYVDWFNMVGAANEGGEFNKAIAFVKLTTGKTLVFQNKDYYIENFQTAWAGGGTIEGNGATFHHTYATDNYEEFLTISGSVGTYDTLTVDAVYGSYILTVPVGSALLSLNRGDMVKIISDGSADLAGQYIGEIKIVDTVLAVGQNVVFTEPLYNTYLATDDARMAEVTPGTAILKDFKLIGNTGRGWNLGITLKYVNRPLVQNVEFHNFQYHALGLQDCYNGRFDIVADNALDNTGQGYGIVLYGACMNNLVTIRGTKLRHIIATGGNGTQGGIPYNNTFVDCIGTGVYSHAFDMHEAAGTGNKYSNCKVSGGVFVSDTANFQGVWASGTTYDNNDIVSLSNQLYKSATNGNLNNSPASDLGTNWEIYSNGIYGFNILGGDAIIENCEATGFNSGVAIVNMNRRNLKVDGLKAINCRYAVSIVADTLSNSSFNNIQLQNETFKDDAFAIYLLNSTLNKVSFSNISAKGGFGFSLSGCTFTDKKLEVNSVVADGLIVVSAQTPEVHFNCGTAFLTQRSDVFGYVISTVATSNGLKSINVNNMTVQGATARPVSIASRLNSLKFGSVYLTDGSTTEFIDNTDSIDRCDIGYIYNDGSGTIEILENTGAYVGTFNIGNSGGNLNATAWYAGNYPTTVNASINGFVDAIDFKAPASIYDGWIKQGGHFLINTFKTGNLGVGYDALTVSAGLGYGNSFRNTAIGYLSQAYLAAATDNTTLGDHAGWYNADGDYNTYIGGTSGQGHRGSQNTALGYASLFGVSGSTGNNNIGIGYKALYSHNGGGYNVAVGDSAGYAGTTLSFNTLLGHGAGRSLTNGVGNVMIGWHAGINETGSNKGYIENSPADSNNALQFMNFATDKLTINGTLNVTKLPVTTGKDTNVVIQAGILYKQLATAGTQSYWSSNGWRYGYEVPDGFDNNFDTAVVMGYSNTAKTKGSYIMTGSGSSPFYQNDFIVKQFDTASTISQGYKLMSLSVGQEGIGASSIKIEPESVIITTDNFRVNGLTPLTALPA